MYVFVYAAFVLRKCFGLFISRMFLTLTIFSLVAVSMFGATAGASYYHTHTYSQTVYVVCVEMRFSFDCPTEAADVLTLLPYFGCFFFLSPGCALDLILRSIQSRSACIICILTFPSCLCFVFSSADFSLKLILPNKHMNME